MGDLDGDRAFKPNPGLSDGFDPNENADNRCLTPATSSSPFIDDFGGVDGTGRVELKGSERSFVSISGVAGVVMISLGTGRANLYVPIRFPARCSGSSSSFKSILRGITGRYNECGGTAEIDEFCRRCLPLAFPPDRTR